MRFLLTTLFATALLASSCSMNTSPEILAMTSYADIVDRKTGAITPANTDTSLVSRLGNIILYRKTIRGTVYNEKAIKNGVMEAGDDPATISSRSFEHRFFIHYMDQKTGMRYDSIAANGNRKRFNVDSLLMEDPILKGGTADFDDKSILLSKTNTKEGYVKETYKYTANLGDNYPDSAYLIFDKSWKNKINYTLSKNIDSVRKMKLVRINLIFNPISKEKSGSGAAIPKKVIDVKIFEPNLNKHDLLEIKQAFEKFKQDEKEDQ
ncbi:hypothetical protein [Pedobacter sp. D749]|uniref:hypothetical protein n=1 Tax=Pedobacter sp. D749 TaxID=2856523 RepID=UPI001C59002E|nr:hypothetical protein [Pedobacter sp. D749]QXU40002.1 hypothetical protein KYH19_13335 [Pedobacter sp. D749]